MEFLHLLQKEGYADVAIDYLDQLKADPNAPKEIMDVWDLEMSRSKKAARQGQAYSDAQAKQWTEESKALLERFIKANPDRPEAIQEAARWSEEKALEGQYRCCGPTYTTDKAEKAKLLAEARKIFEEIRPRFVKAEKASVKLLDSLPREGAARPKAIDAAIMVGENRLTVAMVDFYLAQTQEAGPQRTAALTKCDQGIRRHLPGLPRSLPWAFMAGPLLARADPAGTGPDQRRQGHLRRSGGLRRPTTSRRWATSSRRRAQERERPLQKTGLEDFFADVEQYYLQTLYQLSQARTTWKRPRPGGPRTRPIRKNVTVTRH